MDAPWPGSVYDGAGSGVSDGLSYSDDLPFGFNPQDLSEAPQVPGETCPPSSLDYLGGVTALDIGDLDGSMFIDGWGASSSYDDLSGFGAHDDFTTDAFTEACPEVRLRGADGPYTPP
jgi:hypothetical protein